MPLIFYNNGRAQVQDVTGVRIQSRNMAAPQRAAKRKSRSSSVAPGLPKPFSLWPHRPRPCSCVPERPRPSSAPRAQMHLGKYAQMAGVGSTCSSHRLEISCSQVRVKKERDIGVKLPVKHAMVRNAIQVKPQPKKRQKMTLAVRKMMTIYQAKKRARPCPPPHPPPLHKLPVLKNMHFPKAAIPPLAEIKGEKLSPSPARPQMLSPPARPHMLSPPARSRGTLLSPAPARPRMLSPLAKRQRLLSPELAKRMRENVFFARSHATGIQQKSFEDELLAIAQVRKSKVPFSSPSRHALLSIVRTASP